MTLRLKMFLESIENMTLIIHSILQSALHAPYVRNDKMFLPPLLLQKPGSLLN